MGLGISYTTLFVPSPYLQLEDQHLQLEDKCFPLQRALQILILSLYVSIKTGGKTDVNKNTVLTWVEYHRWSLLMLWHHT